MTEGMKRGQLQAAAIRSVLAYFFCPKGKPLQTRLIWIFFFLLKARIKKKKICVSQYNSITAYMTPKKVFRNKESFSAGQVAGRSHSLNRSKWQWHFSESLGGSDLLSNRVNEDLALWSLNFEQFWRDLEFFLFGLREKKYGSHRVSAKQTGSRAKRTQKDHWVRKMKREHKKYSPSPIHLHWMGRGGGGWEGS